MSTTWDEMVNDTLRELEARQKIASNRSTNYESDEDLLPLPGTPFKQPKKHRVEGEGLPLPKLEYRGVAAEKRQLRRNLAESEGLPLPGSPFRKPVAGLEPDEMDDARQVRTDDTGNAVIGFKPSDKPNADSDVNGEFYW